MLAGQSVMRSDAAVVRRLARKGCEESVHACMGSLCLSANHRNTLVYGWRADMVRTFFLVV